MSTPYTAGRRAEYAAIKQLREEGYEAFRSAGSHGPFDIVAWNRGKVLFIQVKRVREFPFIRHALARAKKEVSGTQIPISPKCSIEIWIRYNGAFYVYTQPFHELPRRII